MSVFLSNSGGVSLEIFPEYNFKDGGRKIEDRHRTRDGSEFVYKWGEYRLIEIDVKYVNSSFRTIVNSWWSVNEDLLYIDDDVPDSRWDVSSSIYESETYNMTEDTNIAGITVGKSGQKAYALGTSSEAIFQYSTLIDWEINSLSYDSKNLVVSSQDTTPVKSRFSDDGSKLFMLGQANLSLYQYTPQTAWEVESATYDNVSFDVSCWCVLPEGFDFNNDGSKFYVTDTNDNILRQFGTLTNWRIESAYYDNASFDASVQDSAIADVVVKPSGERFFLLGRSNDAIYQYDALTNDDVSSLSYSGEVVVDSQTIATRGMDISSDGSKLYFCGTFGGSNTYQRNMLVHGVTVRLINRSKPIDQFEKPYSDLFKGTIELGTY